MYTEVSEEYLEKIDELERHVRQIDQREATHDASNVALHRGQNVLNDVTSMRLDGLTKNVDDLIETLTFVMNTVGRLQDEVYALKSRVAIMEELDDDGDAEGDDD